KIDAILRPPSSSISAEHTATEFALYFQSKVDAIRSAMDNAAPPIIIQRVGPPLSGFDKVTADEVIRVVSRSPTKHCSLDPAPTWLVKRLLPCLADSIARMCNASLTEEIVPSLLKAAVVSPRLKKPTLDPEDMSSYWPISNLSFISKTLERLVATRFVQHSETHHLLPSRQSSYRVNHSTKTAAVSAHNNIVRAIDDGQVSLMVLLDLSAAFDTVDHDTLIQVL